jgi:lipopolysaccharide export system protein LptA
MRTASYLLAVLIALIPVAARAENPVKITADTFVINEADSQAIFTGNVIVIRPGLTVWADKVEVDYGEAGPESIKTFTAIGNVRLKTEDQDASGDRATFNPDTQILRLLGNVVVVNATGTLNGPELEINLADNTTVFTGGEGGRVTGVFNAQ